MSESALAFIHELERADEEVSAVLDELDELARESEAVRARAIELNEFLGQLPAERETVAAVLAQAELDLAHGRKSLEVAERELASAEREGSPERVASARRVHTRARDALRMAERRATEARDDAARLEAEAEASEREAPALEARAGELAAVLRNRPRLAERAGAEPRGLDGVAEWGSEARAALFVARGGLAAERDALVRQANELGALVLGEPLTSSSAAVVARRVERARGE